jgi:tRNA A37 threonylcarbamoyladenosine biosynthesis protein TsaE
MEWADRWPEILPEACLMVKLVILDDNQREITFSGQHQRAVELITTMEMKKDLNATL